MNTAERLSGFERCGRIPWWGKDWKAVKMRPVEMIAAGVRAGLTEHTRSDFGEAAGEEVYGFGAVRPIDSKEFNLHDEVVHLAALADVITCAIRRPGTPPWIPAPPLPDWKTGCFISPDGGHLRRVVFVTSWSDDRHYAECRSWETLGEICAFGLPLQLLVVRLGSHAGGKYSSPWTRCALHPSGQRMPRFRRRTDVAQGFKETWNMTWRESRDDIATESWLQGMLNDHVLEECLVKIEVPVPRPEQRRMVLELAREKMVRMEAARELPLQNLTTCDWPVPCGFRGPCHAQQKPGPEWGFIQIEQ